MTALLELSGVTVSRAGRPVLQDAALAVETGEMLGVVGPNGAGKTTLLRAALGLWQADAGTVRLGEEEIGRLGPAERARRAGYLPQERRLAWNVSALDAASLGAPAGPPAAARDIARAALAQVGLSHLQERGVFDMSGGERARVLLARLFATRAPLLITDEPAAGLDPDAQLLVLELLQAHARRGGAVVVTLHDLALAARFCDRLLVLKAGRVAASGPPRAALTSQVLADVFGLDGAITDTPAGPVLAARRIGAAA